MFFINYEIYWNHIIVFRSIMTLYTLILDVRFEYFLQKPPVEIKFFGSNVILDFSWTFCEQQLNASSCFSEIMRYIRTISLFFRSILTLYTLILDVRFRYFLQKPPVEINFFGSNVILDLSWTFYEQPLNAPS